MKAAFISALFVAGAIAAPRVVVNKREVFTEEVVVTEWTTTTVYVDATAAAGVFAEVNSTSSASSVVIPTSSVLASLPSSPPAAPPVPTTTTVPAVVAVVTPPPVAAPVTTPAAPAVVVPAPVANFVAAPAAQVAPAPPAIAPSSGGGPSGTGEITFYDLGMTSCGQVYSDSDNVVALAVSVMNNPANPNNNPICGKTITITANGKTVTGRVVDTCQGCAAGDVDLSPALFNALMGGPGAGRVPGAKWFVS